MIAHLAGQGDEIRIKHIEGLLPALVLLGFDVLLLVLSQHNVVHETAAFRFWDIVLE